jgi:RND family efflux transporter MFP subunit
VLATIASPEVAEMRGKLREAQNSLTLAQRNLERVQRSENRVAVLSAKAKLEEADANLKRTRRLIDLGVGAGKDLVAAETAYKTAKAEYDFQSNIALNREVQEAQAQVATARVEIEHLQESLRAIGADDTGSSGNTSLIAVRAPGSGAVIERLVNPGAGVESGKPLFTIGNLSTVWVIANVPEAQVGALHVGTPAEVRSAALGPSAIPARVSYIDPQLDESTRTAKVRLDLPNKGERLKAGMFVEVGLQAGTAQGEGEELVVPSEAVQRVGESEVVFIPEEEEPGHFKVRKVELGTEVGGYRRVLAGLKQDDKVVTKGSFTLKAQLMKSQFGEDED